MSVKDSVLIETAEAITETSLRAVLPERYKKNPVYIYDSVSSTNSSAKQLAAEGACHGTIVIAHEQTAGKGRLGRNFHSPINGIYLSVLIKPNFDPGCSGLLTTAAATAAAEAIQKVSGQDARIKWINDIYINEKKVCGILSEGITDFESGNIEEIIVGIGINTRTENFPEDLLNTAGAVEGVFSNSALTAEVITGLLDYAAVLESRTFLDSYRHKSLVIGKPITVYKGIYRVSPDEVPSFQAKAIEIDNDGGLVVEYPDKTRETLTTGEISIRLDKNS